MRTRREIDVREDPPEHQTTPTLLTPAEAARALGRDPNTIRRWAKNGILLPRQQEPLAFDEAVIRQRVLDDLAQRGLEVLGIEVIDLRNEDQSLDLPHEHRRQPQVPIPPTERAIPTSGDQDAQVESANNRDLRAELERVKQVLHGLKMAHVTLTDTLDVFSPETPNN